MNENDSYIGKTLDGRYEIMNIIGEGGMAIVYRALDHRLNRYVAVKIMRSEMATDEDFRRRFNAESQAVAMLSHPNIVAVYDVSRSEAMEYIVMELIDGITLKQYMDKRGMLAWREAVHFSKQIAKALSQAHERGIIHRDIKPQNIMLLRDGTIKVADFGIAALENEVEEKPDGQAIGSIHYIAPEQARGESPDARSDIYSLGILMYEMLTGNVPYSGDTLGEVAIKHMQSAPVSPREVNPEISEELERITLKAMASRIDMRYQSAAELLSDLDKLTAVKPQPEEEKEPTDEVGHGVKPVRSSTELSKANYQRRRRRASKVSSAAGFFLLLVLCIGLFKYLWDFWLYDVFSPAVRIPLQNFIGMNYSQIESNTELLSRYNFDVIFVINTDSPAGQVLEQEPSAGRSMMVTPEGIDVTLKVSTGGNIATVPELRNRSYVDAMNALSSLGLAVEIENSVSDTITRDYVISTSPVAGEQLSLGSTVYLLVSSGPEIQYVEMPNLVGLSEEAARSKLESSRLSYGGATRVISDYDAGTVIGQSCDAFSSVEEHSKITLTVSAGHEQG